jgi:subtilisin family serine protease
MRQVCWGINGGCTTAAIVHAIEDAIQDGVDILSISLGAINSDYMDPANEAYRSAASAGIFISTSAGNDGPGYLTLGNIPPWVMTTAAGTLGRASTIEVTIDGQVLTGSGSSDAGGVISELVLSTEIATSPGAQLCYPGSIDATRAAGKIVVCDRGEIALSTKAQTALDAGAAGVIILNVAGGLATLPYVNFPIPGAILPLSFHGTVVNASVVGHTAIIGLGSIALNASPAPDVADFSSRGPDFASIGFIVKPDILAPGQDILAAVAGELGFDFYSGTSMAAPHVSGIAAVLKTAHPAWDSVTIYSALITTARRTRTDGSAIAGGVLDYGAGLVNAAGALNPVLIYRVTATDWANIACTFRQECTGYNPMQYNAPSIALKPGYQAQRTVTNIADGTATVVLDSSIPILPGCSVVVNPTSFELASGASQMFTVYVCIDNLKYFSCSIQFGF